MLFGDSLFGRRYASNSQFDLFGVILGWEKPFEERRKPFHGAPAADILKTLPPALFKLRVAAVMQSFS
ncbi:hypothetical protein [Methylicorpusculum sp.]|uniref:hypothetical protein n=1 Tax=Methylicorpusculum sp. TaxID=2713644 RepID=UPI002AB9C3AD|nr:hypothetical protein [Methylicorpusculum sp.]MDZ4152535.1 hypothetical protein [Methylicorpusculum sp.]